MAAHLVRLKLTLLRNGLRRSGWQLAGMIVGVLYGLGAVAVALGGLVALSTQETELVDTLLVLLGGLLVLGWWVLPLVAFGVDATLDPARFVTFAIPRRDMLVGLSLAGLVGIPGVATILVCLVAAFTWWRTPVAVLPGLVTAVLVVATCVVGSRAVTTVLAPVVTARRFREVATIVVMVPLFLLGPILNGLSRGVELGADAFPGMADVVGWTPVGAAWAIPGAVAEGAWGAAVGHLAVALATLVLLVAAWDRALSAALVRPLRSVSGPARSRGLGVFARVPQTPVGAIVARCLTYWFRDPRYAAGVVIVPLVPVLLWFVTDGNDGMLALGPIVAMLLGWTISADVAYDATAFWTHVAAPISGRVDRLGRVGATGVLGLPVALLFAVLSLALTGRWDAALPVVGMSVGVLLTSLGVASVASVRIVYEVPKPGDSPFSSPQGGATSAMISQTVGWLLLMALVLPTVALGVAAVVTGSTLLEVLSLVVALGLGGALLRVGVRMGGQVYDRRAPELLQKLVSYA